MVSRTDSRVTLFTDIMGALGFTGYENINMNRLVTAQAIERSIEIVQSMRNCIQNSGLDNHDSNMLLGDLKIMITEAFNQ